MDQTWECPKTILKKKNSEASPSLRYLTVIVLVSIIIIIVTV